MAFDYSKLRGKIVEVFGTQSACAKRLNVSERTLSLKLNGRIFFSQDDILRLSDALGLTECDIPIYFFTQKVQ